VAEQDNSKTFMYKDEPDCVSLY